MRTTAALLLSLETITHETTRMLTVLETADRAHEQRIRETRVHVEELRTKAQELMDLLSEVWFEERTN